MNSLKPASPQSCVADSESRSLESSTEPCTMERVVAPNQSRPLRLLVVDDYDDMVDSLGMLLRAWGHHVLTCRSGPEAVQSASAYQPDAAFIDIMMPGMNGYEVARRLRMRCDLQGMILVALTGLGDHAHRRLSQEAGFALHLLKPVDCDKLREILAAILVKRNRLQG
jgi:CheY-like chemotaxis protein